MSRHAIVFGLVLMTALEVGCVSAPVKTSKYPWINTWAIEYYDSDAPTLRNDSDHFDFHLGPHDPMGLKALTPKTLTVKYVLLDTQVKDSDGDGDRKHMTDWAARRPGANVEDFYIHYKEDVVTKGKGGEPISIPGWDPTNDSDGDGVRDADVNPRATARTRADARVYYYEWQSYFYALNVGNSMYRWFKAEDCAADLVRAPGYDGFMADTAVPGIKKPQVISGSEIITEYPNQDKWRADFAGLVSKVRSRLGANKYIIGNTAGYYYPEMADAGGGEHQEMYVAFTNEHGPDKWDYLKQQSDKGMYSFWEPAWDAYTADLDRERMHYLAYHYMGQQPYVYLGFRGFGYRDIFKDPSPYDWLPACEVDVGQPVDDKYQVVAKGVDSTGQNYRIFARRYSNSLILCRPKINWSHDNYGDNTGVVIALPSYATSTGGGNLFTPLKVDGTLGPAVSQVTLRQPESAILFPAETWLAPVLPVKDAASPRITQVTAGEIGMDSATITWQTDKLSSSAVDYGQTTDYGAGIQTPELLVLSHSLVLTGLLPSTTYHFRVKSIDASGNVGISGDYTFTTQSEVQPPKAAFFRDWLVVGPFFSPDRLGFYIDYIGERYILPSRQIMSSGRVWSLYESQGDYIDLASRFFPSEYVVAYAHLYVLSPTDQSCQLWLGSDDGIEVWLNGSLVYASFSLRPAVPDSIMAPISLRQGWNRLLLKVDNEKGDWGFYVRIRDSNGNPLPAIQYQVDNPVPNP